MPEMNEETNEKMEMNEKITLPFVEEGSLDESQSSYPDIPDISKYRTSNVKSEYTLDDDKVDSFDMKWEIIENTLTITTSDRFFVDNGIGGIVELPEGYSCRKKNRFDTRTPVEDFIVYDKDNNKIDLPICGCVHYKDGKIKLNDKLGDKVEIRYATPSYLYVPSDVEDMAVEDTAIMD